MIRIVSCFDERVIASDPSGRFGSQSAEWNNPFTTQYHQEIGCSARNDLLNSALSGHHGLLSGPDLLASSGLGAAAGLPAAALPVGYALARAAACSLAD